MNIRSHANTQTITTVLVPILLLAVLIFVLFFMNNISNQDNEIRPEQESVVLGSDDTIPIIPDVPKDAIPPLDSPAYDSTTISDEWLKDDDIVLAVVINDDARAYPLKIMNWHEIVNDTIGGKEVTVTFCPLCDSGIVFDPFVNGQKLTFGNTGALYESAMVMYDRQTESYWYQAGARAVRGSLTGERLGILPSRMITWGDWKTTYPEGRVLSLNTGHSRPYTRDSFAGYDRPDSRPGFPVSVESDRLPPKERIVGIELNGKGKAYPVKLAQGTILKDSFEGKEIEVVGDSIGRTAEVFFIEDGARVPAPVVSEFWFSWFINHPETQIFSRPL